MLCKVVPSNYYGTGVYTGVPDCSLKFLGIFKGILNTRNIRVFVCLLHLRNQFHTVLHSYLHLLGLLLHLTVLICIFLNLLRETVGNKFGKAVTLRKGYLLYSGHILYGTLGGHCAECNHVGYVVFSIFLLHILQHLATAVIIKVHVYIGH